VYFERCREILCMKEKVEADIAVVYERKAAPETI
jgi:hypothetical protein